MSYRSKRKIWTSREGSKDIYKLYNEKIRDTLNESRNVMSSSCFNFYNKGYSIENFYCSTDTQSLDGVRIIEKNVAI